MGLYGYSVKSFGQTTRMTVIAVVGSASEYQLVVDLRRRYRDIWNESMKDLTGPVILRTNISKFPQNFKNQLNFEAAIIMIDDFVIKI